jgi:copper chaperone CopZ
MRRFAIGTMLVLGLAAAGCDKPVEGIPSSSGSGVSAGDDLSVEMPSDKPAVDSLALVTEDAAPPSVPAPAAEPSTDSTPPADPAPAEPPKVDNPEPAVETPKQSSTDKSAGKAGKLVSATLKVPTMSCPHGCWPTVKETLTAQPGVESVELAKQATADAIDNPVIHVKLNGKFDSKAAVAALAKAGFDNAEVVN